MAMSKAKSISLISIAVILLLLFGAGSFIYFGTFSNGDRAGVVIKISQRGYLFKTWEGEMNLNDQGNTIEKFEFSVEDNQTKVIEDLKDAALTGERVRISYVERYRAFSWRGDTKYFITNVIRQKNNELRNNKEGSRANSNTEETESENKNQNTETQQENTQTEEPVSTDTTTRAI